ncbi:diaminopimelate decarboxylase [Haloarchaeobius sp. HME9146]|uniref:diaminopimelate decarboxylase n=1 Tax=Haloarchaeobius sp. HME9146 TaxID=2978732 RepID=UPI0021BF94FB|nr:diaminopimelate decarboxylase [Haloarchaeobius sp. HME9146]MCT9095925.1 diaminopimelate decarboxylase [Haloarchaeobius sp. HME9146]
MSGEVARADDVAAQDGGASIRRLADWDAAGLRDFAAEYGSPLYVLDLDRVRENYRRLDAAFPQSDVFYAAKANTLGRCLATLHDEGAGIECASAGEVARALDAGVPGDRIQYTAVNPPAEDLMTVVGLWQDYPDLTVTVGAADTLDRLEARGYDGRLCLRVNPGVGAGHHEKVQTGADAKFGVPYDEATDLLAEAADRGFDVVGIHAHAGSGISGEEDLASHRELVARMGDLARDAPVDLEFVDVGGGFGVPYHEDEEPLDLDAVAEATREAVGDIDATLQVEPGRYLVADAGVLLTTINTVKEAPDTTVVGLDAGMTTLLRPAMYDAYHAMRNLNAEDRDGDLVDQTVVGPICESSDAFCQNRPLPAPERDDILAIGNAGAYGYEMASHYNSRPRPATITIADGAASLARRRETIADITRQEVSE